MAIRVTESEYADFTFDVDGEEQFTLSLDQASRLREWLQRNLPASTRSRGQRIKSIWRHIKASHYERRLRLLPDMDGETAVVGLDMPNQGQLPPIVEFIGHLPTADRETARQYFRDLGGEF